MAATGDLDGVPATTSVWAYGGKLLSGAMRLAPTITEPTNPED